MDEGRGGEGDREGELREGKRDPGKAYAGKARGRNMQVCIFGASKRRQLPDPALYSGVKAEGTASRPISDQYLPTGDYR